MKTFAFDSLGQCICVINSDYDYDAPFVVKQDIEATANDVWFDISTNSMMLKTAFPIITSLNTISNIPTQTSAVVNGELIEINDGVIAFEVSSPQNVLVVLMHIQHIMTEVEVPCAPEN